MEEIPHIVFDAFFEFVKEKTGAESDKIKNFSLKPDGPHHYTVTAYIPGAAIWGELYYSQVLGVWGYLSLQTQNGRQEFQVRSDRDENVNDQEGK